MLQTEFKCLRCAAVFAIEHTFSDSSPGKKVRCPRCTSALVFARFRSSAAKSSPPPFELADLPAVIKPATGATSPVHRP